MIIFPVRSNSWQTSRRCAVPRPAVSTDPRDAPPLPESNYAAPPGTVACRFLITERRRGGAVSISARVKYLRGDDTGRIPSSRRRQLLTSDVWRGRRRIGDGEGRGRGGGGEGEGRDRRWGGEGEERQREGIGEGEGRDRGGERDQLEGEEGRVSVSSWLASETENH